jgi:hypothetical protein
MADKIVEVPNIGRVAFPSAMTDEEILKAIGDLLSGGAQAPDTLSRQAGLAVRPMAQAVMTGGGMLPLAVDPLVNLFNLAAGTNVPTMTQATQTTLNRMGFPQPRTAQERVVQDVAGAGYGVGGLANLAARAAPIVTSPTAQGVTQMLATNPLAQSSAALASSAAGGALREGEFSPGVQLVGAMGAGMIAPGGQSLPLTQRAVAGTGALVQPFSREGRQVIVGNVLRNVATNPEQAMANLQQAQPTVPGLRLTTAAAARDPGLAGLETPLRSAVFDPSNQFGARLSANQQALLEGFRRLSGRPGSIVQAETKRNELTGPMREAAFANVQVDPATFQSGISLVVNRAVDNVMGSSVGVRKDVETAMKFATDRIARAKNPEELYEVRKDLAAAAQGKYNQENPSLRLAKGQLNDVISTIDDVIEAAAPGYQQYMSQFRKSSSAIDQMRVLQGIQDRVTTGQTNVMTGEPVLAAGALRRELKTKADELDLKLSDAAQRRLDNIINEINRGQAATAPGVRAPGSNTFQNMSMGNLIGRVFSESMADNTTLRTMTRPLDWLYKLPDQQVQQLLVEAMLDPKLAAQMMSKASIMKVEPLAKSLRKKAEQLGYGSIIGAAQE